MAPLLALVGLLPVQAQTGLPAGVSCSQASSGSPVVCTGKIPSWDGIPLDADLTLPPGPITPRPLIVMLHGYANDKTEWESSSPSSTNPDKDHYNTAWFASLGYAVLTYTARGFHGSCGQGPLTDPRCARGWTHLADRRFEVRDTQYLAGLLADFGVADPRRIAVTGDSYGGGQSLLLALQGDRVAAVPDPANPATYDQAQLVPWRSPLRQLRMHLVAAVPKYPWSDLVESLVPNGRASDGVTLPDGNRLSPVGIEKQSYVTYLFGSGSLPTGYYCPQPCADPSANLTAWFAGVNAGEPYLPADPVLAQALTQLSTWKSAYYQDALIDRSRDLVPIFDLQGWTDNLFPEVEGVSLINKLRAHGWPVKVALADIGHPLAQNPSSVWSRLNTLATGFLDHYLMGGAAPALDASAQVTTCDGTNGNIYQQADWAGLAPYRVAFSSTNPTPLATAYQPADPLGPSTDPIGVAAIHGGHGACVIVPAGPPWPTSHWDFSVTSPVTLLGEPAIHLSVVVAGVDAEIDTRLWDVGTDGSATLVTRGAYRYNGIGGPTTIDATLEGNAWDFQPGHSIRLDVTQADAPYLRPDNLPSGVVYSSVTLTLPTPTTPAA
jgi:acetyl esterase/lipase